MQNAIKQLTLDELIAIAGQEQAKHKERFGEELSPHSLLCALSAHILARNLPAHAERFLAREYDKIEQSFAMDILGANDLPGSLLLPEERQVQLYGGIEPMLFDKMPPGIFAHYERSLGRKPADNDPLNWDATEIG